MELLEKNIANFEEGNMIDILSHRTHREIENIGREVAQEIQKKYKPSYAEAELILAMALVTLKNMPLSEVDLASLRSYIIPPR